MPWYIVTYDVAVPARQKAFVEHAGNLGWTTWCPSDENGERTLLRLPGNTLMAQFRNLAAAEAAFNLAIEKAGATPTGGEVVGKYLLVARRAAILHSEETPQVPKRRRRR